MSPAGHWPQLHAAIEAGADSVYFGLTHFTARAKVGFTLSELPEAMRTLHARGVKGFVTFNTLIFDHELDEAMRALAAIVQAGADAIIVQDVAVLKLAREMAPDLEIHASTQMSITSAEGVEFATRLGANRVTLARELSLAEVRAIRARTETELEIFVHGALCVAYSGQCFSSEAWGGRSANRGQCAQACRLPYEMIVDGEPRPLGDARYLLSPGDLYALHHVPEIVEIGVSALKIEGRYKDADYVALATSAYRKAVDDAWAQRPLAIAPAEELRLEQVYSRGLAPHFITGTNHQTVVNGRAPRHRGVLMGRVHRATSTGVVIEGSSANRVAPLKAGDGVVFDAADWRSPQEPEEGGRVFQALDAGAGRIELRFANGALDPHRIRAGDLLWRTHDPELDKAVRPFLEPARPVHRQPVHVRVEACEGERLKAEWRLEQRPEFSVVVESDATLGPADQRGLTAELLKDQFGRLGNTPYELTQLEARISGNPFAPVSVLNKLRREAVERLAEIQTRPRAARLLPHFRVQRSGVRASEAASPKLHLLVRTAEQLDAVLDLEPASITLDYLDLYGLKPSVDRVKASGVPVRIATPRVLKPGEERVLDFILRLDCPILVRATGVLQALETVSHPPLTGDFSLNAANTAAADLLLGMGLDRITPSYDLNAAQVADLARGVAPDRIEAVVYQHLPVFHTEHCVFCRFLSTGTTYKDCGRPCETHRVEVRDPSGRAHPVIADVGCRNTVFGAEAQDASSHLHAWRDAGIEHYRVEFAHETGSHAARITGLFMDFFKGSRTAVQLAQELRRAAPQGTTEGSLFVPANYLTLPVLQ